MRIDSGRGAQAPSDVTQNANPAAAPEAGRVSNAATLVGEDRAQFSGAQVQVQALAAQVTQMPEINQARVDTLRQSLLDGTYAPNSADIADALVADMVEPGRGLVRLDLGPLSGLSSWATETVGSPAPVGTGTGLQAQQITRTKSFA